MSQTGYSDINTMHGVTSNRDVLKGEAAIINTLNNIMLIQKRSRKWRKNFCSSAFEFLSRPVSILVAIQLRDALLEDFRREQPLAKMQPSDIEVNVARNLNGYDLRVSYVSGLAETRTVIGFNLIAYEPISG